MTAIPHPLAAAHHDDHAHAAHHDLPFLKRYIFSADHKVIGIQFLFMGLFFFIVGGLLAMLIRWQLAWPDAVLTPGHPVPILAKWMGWRSGYMPSDFYTMVFSMHATIMIFFVIIPLLVGTFGNYLIPLQIGAGDMAFPFLNGVAFWSALPAGTVMLTGFSLAGGAAAAGWTVYPPLSAMIQTSGAVAFPTTFLRIAHSTWPTLPLITNFVSFFLFSCYICTYYVHSRKLGSSVWIVGVLALMLALCDKLAGMPGTSTILIAIVIVAIFGIALSQISDAISRAVLSIIVSACTAIFAVRGLQYICFDGQSCWFFALFWLGFSSIMGAVNYLTTIIKLRAPGMTMFRMPLSVWSLFITSILVLLATPVLAGTLLMNLLEHQQIPAIIAGSNVRMASFFTPYNWTLSGQIQGNSGGGYVILHQHLFWFYSHPAVYIMILPAMGMVSDVISTFSRKPIFGYRPMVYAMAGIAFLGFIVWAHHMFQSGMNPTLGTTFAVSTIFISVPSAIKTFNWLGTLWGGNIRFTTAMWNAVAFVAMFVIGGLSGVFMASTAIDVHIHDTYFIVAHIHYVLFGGSTFGIFAGIYYWYPKMFGRMMSEALGKIHFFLTFLFFNLVFFAMHILGISGFPRRVADYTNYGTYAHYQQMNLFISISAFCLGLSQIPFVINFLGSLVWGKKAPQNPWNANTLEWAAAPSPPPHGNFAKVPVVHHGPYEYSSPLVEEDWLPQTRYVEGQENMAHMGH